MFDPWRSNRELGEIVNSRRCNRLEPLSFDDDGFHLRLAVGRIGGAAGRCERQDDVQTENRVSGTLDWFEAKRRTVAATGINMFTRHVGECAVALIRRRKPVSAFEIGAEQSVQWIGRMQLHANAETALVDWRAVQIMLMTDFHRAES